MKSGSPVRPRPRSGGRGGRSVRGRPTPSPMPLGCRGAASGSARRGQSAAVRGVPPPFPLDTSLTAQRAVGRAVPVFGHQDRSPNSSARRSRGMGTPVSRGPSPAGSDRVANGRFVGAPGTDNAPVLGPGAGLHGGRIAAAQRQAPGSEENVVLPHFSCSPAPLWREWGWGKALRRREVCSRGRTGSQGWAGLTAPPRCHSTAWRTPTAPPRPVPAPASRR